MESSMTDRELWVRTWKTVGAMVGATVVFLGSVSLVVLLAAGRPASPASEAQAAPATTAPSPGAKGSEPALPTSPKSPRRSIVSARTGESI
jgi:hypothetical protein